MKDYKSVKKELKAKANKEKAQILQRFFKTGKWQYGEGDVFLGIAVPELRKIAGKNGDVGMESLRKLLQSKIHEERFVALIILIRKFEKGDNVKKDKIVEFYLENLKWVNSWDLVDVSAYRILGNYLFKRKKDVIYGLAVSENLWERRIAIMTTFYFIKNNQFADTFKISEILLEDEHDLIHKAIGWMLREVGKRDQKAEEIFIEKNYERIHRTTLRYAIEKFTKEKRNYYMQKQR